MGSGDEKVLAHAETLPTISDIAYASDLLPAELIEMFSMTESSKLHLSKLELATEFHY